MIETKNPTLSIIVPVYNSEKFLRRSIDAILNQTFSDFELILVNDGSTDKSLSICKQYSDVDNRIKVIDKKNEGSGPTRNMGINIASGKYLAFPDSDDWLDKNAYKESIRVMEEADSDLLIFGFTTEVYDNLKEKITNVIEDDIPNIFYREQKECRDNWLFLSSKLDMGSPCNKIYKHSIIKKYNLQFPNLRRMQDVVFNLYYYENISSLITIKENFFHRTWHSAEFQRKKMPKDFISCAITYHKTATAMLEKWGKLNDEGKLFLGNSFIEIIMTAEFAYLPAEKPSFMEIYKHIKNINHNSYVHNFLKEYKKSKKTFRKKENAMLYNCNLLLSIYTFLRIKGLL